MTAHPRETELAAYMRKYGVSTKLLAERMRANRLMSVGWYSLEKIADGRCFTSLGLAEAINKATGGEVSVTSLATPPWERVA